MTLDILRRLVQDPDQPVRVNGLLGIARTPGGDWPQAKFWVTNDFVLVYAEVEGQPQLVASAEIVSFTPPTDRAVWTVTTTEGETWELEATGHCGCGSALRDFSPFPPPNRMGT